jgi:hypothetical protein
MRRWSITVRAAVQRSCSMRVAMFRFLSSSTTNYATPISERATIATKFLDDLGVLAFAAVLISLSPHRRSAVDPSP